MTSYEIENYVKNHGYLVDCAVSRIHVRMTSEEREDASQELYETMVKCLHNFNPNMNASVNTYITSSLRKRALNIMRDRFSDKNMVNSNAKSLSTMIHSDDEYVLLEDMIYEDANFEDFIDSKMLVDSVMGMLEPGLRHIVESWASGATITSIAHETGMSVQSTWARVQRAINRMRDIARENGYDEV